MAKPRSRAQQLILTARNNPEFAARLMQQVSEQDRALLTSELIRQPRPRSKLATTTKPGLRKCTPSNGMSAQLNLFAALVSKVG
jgi:hypothetical protein